MPLIKKANIHADMLGNLCLKLRQSYFYKANMNIKS